MTEERKRIEFWNYLTSEKNQPRPKGITAQRLAVIKPQMLKLTEMWLDVIERCGAESKTAQEFYQSDDTGVTSSRTNFWACVRRVINQGNAERENAGGAAKTSEPRRRVDRTEDKRTDQRFTSKKQRQKTERGTRNVMSDSSSASRRGKN